MLGLIHPCRGHISFDGHEVFHGEGPWQGCSKAREHHVDVWWFIPHCLAHFYPHRNGKTNLPAVQHSQGLYCWSSSRSPIQGLVYRHGVCRFHCPHFIFVVVLVSHGLHSGGKDKAPVIESDANWIEFQRRLLTGKRKEKTVFASIDVDILVPYKQNLHSHVRVLIHQSTQSLIDVL